MVILNAMLARNILVNTNVYLFLNVNGTSGNQYGLSEDPPLESEMKLLLARASKRHMV